MDKCKKPFQKYTAQRFRPGNCHVCRQTDAKVKKLGCRKHNYCSMCAEIVPKLADGDFRCPTCPLVVKETNKNKEDCFLASRIERRPRRHRPEPTTEFEKLIDFDCPEDDDDLEGNNEEWEQLLEALTKPASPVKKPSPIEEPDNFYPKLIPRKPSFLHLTMPSAPKDVAKKRQLPNTNLICSTVTQLLNSQYNDQLPWKQAEVTRLSTSSSDSQLNSSRQSFECPSAKVHGDRSYPNRTFETDPSEMERNTSPCKGVRLRSGHSWHRKSPRQGKSPISETEDLLEIIGQIKGPEFLSSSSSRSNSDSSLNSETTNNSYDNFWDSKIG